MLNDHEKSKRGLIFANHGKSLTTPRISGSIEWDEVNTLDDFIQWISHHGMPIHLCFAHDSQNKLAARWLQDYGQRTNISLPIFSIHDTNPERVRAIRQIILYPDQCVGSSNASKAST